jgi:hypothetical protein
MTDDHGQQPTLKEVARLKAAAEGHEKRVALREDSARFLEGKGEHDQAAHERAEADRERDAARDAWDRARVLLGPTQTTDAGLEIPIPSRGDFMRNLQTVAPKSPTDVTDPTR